MKEKVSDYLMEHKGDVSMICITLALTLIGGFLALAFGIHEKGLVALCLGLLAKACIDLLGNMIGMKLSEGNAGIIGVIIGTLIITLI